MPVIIQPGATNTNKAMVLWDNVLSRASVIEVVRADPAHPPINAVSDPATWSYWAKSNAGNNGYVVFDCGTQVTVDSLAIAAHNLSSANTSLSIGISDNASDWTFPYGVLPDNNNDAILLFPSLTSRYFRIQIFAGSSVNSHVGIVFLGKRLVFPHAPVDSYTPLHHARRYEKLYNDSLKGHFLSNRVMSSGAETEVDMGFLDRGWLENNIRGFESHYNQGGTFFYAGCPSRYPDDMGYCRSRGSDESLEIEFIEGDKLASLSFGVRSYVGS